MVLSPDYFKSRNTVKIAKSLLGKFLVRKYAPTRKRSGQKSLTQAFLIIEVEAYDGFKDKASHAHRGKTERNKIMFGEAGHWYVYFTYGMHWMLNIVTGPKDYPAAVLIRGIGVVKGPARVTKLLKIDKRLNGKSANKKSGLWIAASDFPKRASSRRGGTGKVKIKSAPRIGVAYAGPVWGKRKYRFYLE